MDNNSIKISAILPNYNMAEFLQRSLRSLLVQTVPFYEIIIVDDGSTDDSIAVIEQMKKQHPNITLYRHEKNKGVNPALNTGISHAQGDYILLCAADDSYSPELVAKSTAVIRQYPTVGLVCGDALIERFDLSEPFYRMLPYPPNQLTTAEQFRAIADKCYVGFNSGGGMVIKREYALEADMVQNDTRWHGDWLLYIVVAFRHGFYYINEEFIHITMRKASYSEGKSNIDVQNKVMLNTVHTIYKKYPDVWPYFRQAGLMPHYAIRYIKLFLADPVARRFITPRLCWKFIINNKLVVRIGRNLFPYKFILKMRKLLRA